MLRRAWLKILLCIFFQKNDHIQSIWTVWGKSSLNEILSYCKQNCSKAFWKDYLPYLQWQLMHTYKQEFPGLEIEGHLLVGKSWLMLKSAEGWQLSFVAVTWHTAVASPVCLLLAYVASDFRLFLCSWVEGDGVELRRKVHNICLSVLGPSTYTHPSNVLCRCYSHDNSSLYNYLE